MATPHKFELGLLPERKMDWRTLATSYGLECVFILFILFLGVLFPDRMQLRPKYTVTEIVPRPDLRPKPLKPRKVQPQPRPVRAKLLPPAPVQVAKLFVPRDLRSRKKKKPEEVEPPKIEVKNTPPPEFVPAMSGARQPRIIYTGAFGSSAPATTNAPVEKVQTGGFGAPDGLKGDGKDNAHLGVARLGSFDLPEGQGKGNGSGGTKGMQGTIASAGFGNGIAQGGQGDGRAAGRGAPVQAAGFSTQELAHNGVKTVPTDNAPATTPVEIIFKPNPAYTEEARQLKLEGEVLLEVMFGANGQLHVNRVVRGMGHGLDETAIAAANKMRFKPAQRNGSPVDSTAVVHVMFQLAF
jgi:TonB family protein